LAEVPNPLSVGVVNVSRAWVNRVLVGWSALVILLDLVRTSPAFVLSHVVLSSLPSDDAATKLLWLALRNVMSKSVRSTREWKNAMNQFAILYGDRFTISRA